MAFAKSALNQLFSWCPLNQQSRSGSVEQARDATPPAGEAISTRRDERHPRANGVVHRTMSPDLRQCEPWRQATLLDAATRNDPARHERLAR